jgi:hypothetical protein
MTIKEFRKEFKSERILNKRYLDDKYFTYRMLYKSTEYLRKELNKVKDGKVKNQLKYDIVTYEDKISKQLESQFVFNL